MPVTQLLVAQSPGPSHSCPVVHFLQVPPQSMSVSAPFLTPSVQLGTWHTPPPHRALAQSKGMEQALPLPHFCVGAQPPPQSTSVSVPFLMPSEHDGAWQDPVMHTALAQSEGCVQAAPVE